MGQDHFDFLSHDRELKFLSSDFFFFFWQRNVLVSLRLSHLLSFILFCLSVVLVILILFASDVMVVNLSKKKSCNLNLDPFL